MVEGLRGILGQMPAAEALVAQRGKERLRKIVWPWHTENMEQNTDLHKSSFGDCDNTECSSGRFITHF